LVVVAKAVYVAACVEKRAYDFKMPVGGGPM
jgi:hypothetical protein